MQLRCSPLVVVAAVAFATPAMAQSLSAGDRHRAGNFDRTYNQAMGYLKDASPAKVAEPKEREYYERKLRDMKALLSQMEAPNHPDVASRRRQLDEYEALLGQKLAGQAGPAPTPAAGASLSAGDNHRLLGFDRDYRNSFSRLTGTAPRDLADPEVTASLQRALDHLRGILEQMDGKAHPEVVERREQVEAYAALLEEKKRLTAADAAAQLYAAFDAAHARVMQELPDAQPSKVVESREATFYEGKLEEMAKALAPFGASDDPEVVKRREQRAACEAMYREKRRTAWTEDDKKRLGAVKGLLDRFRGFEELELSKEAAVQFIAARASVEHAFAVFERDRPEVKAQQERLAWFDQELARMRGVSRDILAKVDEPRRRVAEAYDTYVQQRAAAPAMPGPEPAPTAEAMRAYGQALRRCQEAATAARDLAWDLELGDPDWSGETDADREVRNQAHNVVRFTSALLEESAKPIERFTRAAFKAVEIDPATALRDVKALRAAAVRPGLCEPLTALRDAVPVMKLYVAFLGDEVDEWTAAAPKLLEDKLAALEARIEAQLASERITPPEAPAPALLATAERELRARLGDDLLGVWWDEGPTRQHGTREKIISQTSDKVYYVNEPYDFDEFIVVYAVKEKRWDPRKCMLMYQAFAKNNIACYDEPAGAVYTSAGAAEFKAILVENLPARVGATPSAPKATQEAASTPAPAPTTEPAPTPTPTPTPAPGPAGPAAAPTSGDGVGAGAAPASSGSSGGLCAMATPRPGHHRPFTPVAALALLVAALWQARRRAA